MLSDSERSLLLSPLFAMSTQMCKVICHSRLSWNFHCGSLCDHGNKRNHGGEKKGKKRKKKPHREKYQCSLHWSDLIILTGSINNSSDINFLYLSCHITNYFRKLYSALWVKEWVYRRWIAAICCLAGTDVADNHAADTYWFCNCLHLPLIYSRYKTAHGAVRMCSIH